MRERAIAHLALEAVQPTERAHHGYEDSSHPSSKFSARQSAIQPQTCRPELHTTGPQAYGPPRVDPHLFQVDRIGPRIQATRDQCRRRILPEDYHRLAQPRAQSDRDSLQLEFSRHWLWYCCVDI